jgi:hypothetical protein
MHTTAADKVVLIAILLLAASSCFLVPHWVFSGVPDVEIRVGDRLIGTYTLENDRIVPVVGPLGTTLVEIKGKKVSIISSPCPNHTCVRMGPFGREGGCLICLPNEVSVSSRTRQDGLDAIAR